MLSSYIDSTQNYKGFVLEIEKFRFWDIKDSGWHKRCHISNKAGERLATCKTKKEAKDLIDNGCF